MFYLVALKKKSDFPVSFFQQNIAGNMPAYFYLEQKNCNTLSSQLREALEELGEGDGVYTSCVQVHPLDEHLEIVTPDEQFLRRALLAVQGKIAKARKRIENTRE